jgi:hypothetical protein
MEDWGFDEGRRALLGTEDDCITHVTQRLHRFPGLKLLHLHIGELRLLTPMRIAPAGRAAFRLTMAVDCTWDDQLVVRLGNFGRWRA